MLPVARAVHIKHGSNISKGVLEQNVLVRLLYSNCVPRLVYGAAIKDLNGKEKHQVNVAVNNAIRRIFGFCQYQSIRHLREFYGFKPIEMLFENAFLPRSP